MIIQKSVCCLRILVVAMLALAMVPSQAGSLEPAPSPADDCCVLPGDVNHDGKFDISDLTYYVKYMFQGGEAPVCLAEADLNKDCQLDIADMTEWVCWLFMDCSVWAQCHSCP